PLPAGSGPARLRRRPPPRPRSARPPGRGRRRAHDRLISTPRLVGAKRPPMTSAVSSSWLGVAIVSALPLGTLGCSGGGATGTSGGGTGGTGGTPTTTTTTPTSSSSSGGEPVVPSGFSCSGASPSLAQDVVPITTSNCSETQCHLAMQSGSGIQDQLVGR